METLIAVLYFGCLCGFTFAKTDVRKPPSITKQPMSHVFFKQGDVIHLECKAEGIPAVTYAWKKDDRDVSLTLPKVRRGSDGDISINQTSKEDEGAYFCVASNQYGESLSTYAHVSRAFLDDDSTGSKVDNITVSEGRPFVIPAARLNSSPTRAHNWEIATSTIDLAPRPLQQSHRIQMAFNGDLYFAYAGKEDELDGKLYKSTVHNPTIDVTSRGSYIRISVSKDSADLQDFPPSIMYFSVSQNVSLVGGKIELKCFFSGKPIPAISWIGPRNALPYGRHDFKSFGTELTIYNVMESDEGDYVCTAKNSNGASRHTFHIRVEAAPVFIQESDGPRDVNVTEGDSITFNCSVFGKPLPYILWGQNGQQLRGNAPKRFIFGSDMKTLTIRDVCRDCINRESLSDLMVIQCAAFNVHGNQFRSGYLNVLLRTKVSLSSPTFLSVDLTKKNRLQFDCTVTSDPSTPPRVQWYKMGDEGQRLVHSEPPYVHVMNGNLTINIGPNCFAACDKYLGEYRCIGDNGYSRDSATVSIGTEDVKSSTWLSILVYIFIGLLVLSVGIIFGLFGKRCNAAKKRATLTRDEAISHPISAYEDIGYESIDALREEVVSKEAGPMLVADGMYETIRFGGYDSSDLPLGQVTTVTEVEQSTEQPQEMNPYMEVATDPVLPEVYTALRPDD